MLHALPSLDNTQPSQDYYTQARMLLQEWVDMMDCPPRPYYRRRLFQWLSSGIEADMIRAAMDDTMSAPVPAWRYLEAIMLRCSSERCYTAYGYINRRRPRRD